jgi:feruloyl esterase
VATKYVNDVVGMGVQAQRPLCPYPETARYNGTGNPNVSESWDCKSPYVV